MLNNPLSFLPSNGCVWMQGKGGEEKEGIRKEVESLVWIAKWEKSNLEGRELISLGLKTLKCYHFCT